MKGNKWNEADCGSKLAISEGGLKVEYFGQGSCKNYNILELFLIFIFKGAIGIAFDLNCQFQFH